MPGDNRYLGIRLLRPRLFAGVVVAVSAAWALAPAAEAHGPLFSSSPHTVWKGGMELHLGAEHFNSGNLGQSDLSHNEWSLGYFYGITADWTVGLQVPYQDGFDTPFNRFNAGFGSGTRGIVFSTKWRFRREDLRHGQNSTALLGSIRLPGNGMGLDSPANTHTTSWRLGLADDHEGLKWYRFESLVYQHNDTNTAGYHHGDTVYLNFVPAIRPRTPSYTQPDMVWMLGFNLEFQKHDRLHGRDLPNTGGTRLFVSPQFMYTVRNYAVKFGVQIPVYSRLNGDQSKNDYRVAMEFEWHFHAAG